MKEWNRLGRIILHFVEANCDTPEEGFILIELVRNYLKESYDIDWHIASNKLSEEIDKWTSNQNDEKPISS